MSSKQLTAKVRLDVTQAERQIKSLERKIKKLDAVVNKQAFATNGLSKGFDKAANSASKFDKNVRKSANSVGFLTKKVKLLANAYLGIMGAKAVVNTSDLITSAENKLNNIPGGNAQKTQDTMDKTYAAAQRSRGDYGTMLSNVSKTMTLASDAFQGNVDNAIKFQEIMSKAYTVGGASAAEQSSSMYQLVQALGSGVLQGDELRSVREGAAYAYQEIEKFAQGIYGADKNLKDLASEGLITSEIVVAAIMNAEESINEAFNNTDRTFAQVGTSLKNTAVKAFEPVLQMLNDFLKSDAGNAIINGIGNAIIIVANCTLYLFNLIKRVYQFVVDNWNVIHAILTAIGTAITVYLIYRLILFAATMISNVMMIISLFGSLIRCVITYGLAATASFFGVNIWLWIIIAVIAILIGVVAYLADSFVDACGIVVGAVYWVGAVIYNVLAFIINMVFGLLNAITLVAGNIAIAFYNCWQSAKASFWEWVSECLNGTSTIAKAVSKIAQLFGLDGVSIDAKISAAKSKMRDYYSTDDILSGFSQIEYKSLNQAYQNGYSKGAAGGEWITNKVSGLSEWINNSLPDAFDSAYDVGGIGNGYDPEDALKGIKGDTGDIADSMELTKDDLEYLRRVADMEWKKEFTTANIMVDMTNNNQINGDGDLDGIVTRLADKLYEEMNVVANGVYVY